MAAREGVGKLVVGVDFAPRLVAHAIGEDYGFQNLMPTVCSKMVLDFHPV